MPSALPPVRRVTALTGGQADRIRRLAGVTEQADGVAPLSEQFLLDLAPESGAEHLLAESGAELTGYAQVADPGMPASAAELLVAPAFRRRGIGRALVAALPRDVRIWAHGDLPPARAFATALGLRTVRELHRMRLRFADVELEHPQLPAGLRVRRFRPGLDDEAWVETNAAAFAGHPEQGRLTVADLRQRMAQPWFDPDGLLLVVPDPASGPTPDPVPSTEWPEDAVMRAELLHLLATRGGEGVPGDAPAGPGPAIAAFHWTKAVPAEAAEVYVLGVHPAYQGLGLARTVTLLGLHHLRGLGYDEVTLYTDGDNAPAVQTYRRLGFVTEYVDRMVAFPGMPEGATIPA